MRGSKLKNTPSVEGSERVGDHEDRVRHLAMHGGERLLEIVGLAHTQGLNADTHRLRPFRSRAISQRHAEVGGIVEYGRPPHCRHHFAMATSDPSACCNCSWDLGERASALDEGRSLTPLRSGLRPPRHPPPRSNLFCGGDRGSHNSSGNFDRLARTRRGSCGKPDVITLFI
jgi:hypothetical protein